MMNIRELVCTSVVLRINQCPVLESEVTLRGEVTHSIIAEYFLRAGFNDDRKLTI